MIELSQGLALLAVVLSAPHLKPGQALSIAAGCIVLGGVAFALGIAGVPR